MKTARYLILAALIASSIVVFAQSIEQLYEGANRAYVEKRFAESAELYAKAIAAGADDPNFAYNAACSYALANRADKAFEYLNKAIEAGYSDVSHLKSDPDFQSLYSDSRWNLSVAAISRKAKDRETMWDSPALASGSPESLSEDQKIAGLSKFWSEAKYNFAYPEKLVELDWDALYLSYIPKVRATRSTYEYYLVLQEFCAKLKDGHTNVYFPDAYFRNILGRPGLRTRLIEDKVLINEVWDPDLQKAGIARGMELLRVNGMPVKQFAEQNVIPYSSASTPQDLNTRAYEYFLLSGPISEPLKLTLRSADGRTMEQPVRRLTAEQRNAIAPKSSPFTFRMLPGDIAYVALNSFSDQKAADEYMKAFPEILKSSALILDVRDNGGGNSDVGYRVLATLIKESVPSSRWATRDYKPAFRAWGRADSMYSPSVDRIPPDGEHHYTKPVVVLSSGRSYSAAEDFLVAFDSSKRGLIVGEPSGGSTGQPLFFRLPGGGSARVCSKRDTYADGKPFVGVGVQPQVLVIPTVEDFLAGRDTVLEAAVSELTKKPAK